MIRRLLSLSLISSLLSAAPISDLLNEYEKASDLSQKTKDESAGNLILYTRDDIERMQAQTLKDLLKTVRFFYYAENRMGQPDSLNQDPVTFFSSSMRVYMNDHEMLSSTLGSGFAYFGDIELDFIDHVEIYEGFPQMDFGVEPATMVIRLYTKDARHDSGGRLKLNVGSQGANTQNAYYSEAFEDFSYFAYLGRYDNARKSISEDGNDIGRSSVTNRFYGSLATEDHRFELHGYEQDGDAFLTSLIGTPPESSSQEIRAIDMSLHSAFLDKTLIFDLSYFKGSLEQKAEFTTPIIVPPKPIFATSYEQKLFDESLTASLKKAWKFEHSEMIAGVQFRRKWFDLGHATFNGVTMEVEQAYDEQDIYSFFLQDMISLRENQMLTLSITNQIYKMDSKVPVEEPDLVQLRAGYIITGEAWTSKTFLTRQQFAPEPYMTVNPQYGNIDLKSETYTQVFQEFDYKVARSNNRIVLGYGQRENMPYLSDTTFTMLSSDIDVYTFSSAYEFTHHFRENDKFEFQAAYSRSSSPVDDSEHVDYKSVVMRMLNSYEKVDLFNEFFWKENGSSSQSGIDYSLGVRYFPIRDLSFNIKGENIFDSGPKWQYTSQFDPLNGETGYIEVPIIERRFWLGMEYLF